MLKRNKGFIKMLSVLLASLVLYLSFNYGIAKLTQTKPTQPIVISQVRTTIAEKEVLHKEVILSKFITTKKIQVIQTSVSQQMIISQGAKSGLFKNDKILTFQGIGKYIVDLDKINEENIVINDDEKTVTIFTTKPSAEVELLEEKTEFQDDKGKLSFWDIKLTPEESEKYKYEVKQQMLDKLNGENDEIVETKAKESLESLLLQVTGNKYRVIINFVK